MKWVVRSMILSCLKFLSISQMYLLALVSMPEVGSSRTMNFEFPMKAMPVESLLLWPPERFLLNSLVFSFKFRSAIIFNTSTSIRAGSLPLNTANSSRCSFTVSSSNRMSNYGHTPISLRTSSIWLSMSFPKIEALPEEKLSSPVNIDIVVVLPKIYILLKLLIPAPFPPSNTKI